MRWAVLLGALAATAAVVAPATAGAPVVAASEAPGRVLVLLRLPPPHLRLGGDYAGGYGDGAGRAARRRVGEALVRRHGLKVVEAWPMPLLGVDCLVMAVGAGQSATTLAATLSKLDGVEWAQPVSRFQTRGRVATANDPLFAAQPAAVTWRLAELHRVADGRGASVAVIDSQVERGHPDLAGQAVLNEDFAPAPAGAGEDHGTAVAGIIAARAGNGIGIAGVAPRARLMALRACWRQGPTATVCDSLSLAKALHRAIERRAGIVNLSLGGPHDLLLGRLIDAARARGATVVAAYDAAAPAGGFPASHPGVIAVSDDARLAGRPGVYLAPGRGVPTTISGGGWRLVDGSSYAAAHVSGLLALARGARPVAARSDGGAIDGCATVLGPAACGHRPAPRRD